MPKRKKTNLSQRSAEAKRKKNDRKDETEEERERRLADDRQRHDEIRATESQEARERRLADDRQRHVEIRAIESQEARERRLADDRQRHVEIKAIESQEARERRLADDRQRHVEVRAIESQEARERRLADDRQRHDVIRAIESQEGRERRLADDRQRHDEVRALETDEARTQRLIQDRDHHAILRALETDVMRNQRLQHDREYHALARDVETEAAREERLRQDRESHAHTRAFETDEEYEQRRLADRDRQAVEYRNRQVRQWGMKLNSGFNYDPSIQYAEAADVGGMQEVCGHCNALKWKLEPKGICCSDGKVRLKPILDPPEPLRALLNGSHQHSGHFLKRTRSYNSAFQMTSFGANVVYEGNFMPTFKVQGQVYHRLGSLLPEANSRAAFLQMYFISDYAEELDTRMSKFTNLDRSLMSELQTMLHQNNPYVQDFKMARQLPGFDDDQFRLVINPDRRPESEHRGRHNAPTTNEVAVLLVNQQCGNRDIILRKKHNVGDPLQRIKETHRSYDALQYPLIFCRGEDGYNFGVFQVNPRTGEEIFNKKVSALQFYSYQLMVRKNVYSPLHFFRQLFNQYLVDMYAKIETERLMYIRNNQTALRAENYIHLRDALNRNEDATGLGQIVILPSSFTGGPRYMHQRTQDAFCYIRKYGRPHLFITFTTNPKWVEVTREISPGQSSHDRHDITTRVFKLKLKSMMDLLVKGKIFGPVRCFIYTVEWQKRGLPHAHILLWLVSPIQPDQINNVIQAEIPNEEEDPELLEIVRKNMVHGPCGPANPNSPCMKDLKCTKKYPKAFSKETFTGDDGYPLYRRRDRADGGNCTTIIQHQHAVEIDNRWIVPYSPVLLRTFDAHINVELCSSVKSIQYICKYINKGSDLAVFGVQNKNDELSIFQSGRYISTSEAVWRILAFSIHERYPSITHLDIHLENGQRVVFDPNDPALENELENPKNTTLLAFFKLCESDEFARTLLYDEVPSYYTYDKRNGVFHRRRRGAPIDGYPGVFRDDTLGRVYTIHPNNHECYYLRMLLHVVRGPISFESLKTVNGVICETYQAACFALGLLEDDSHWHNTLNDATLDSSASKLRQLFAIILVFCNVSNPQNLWDSFKVNFSEDVTYDFKQLNQDIDISPHVDDIYNRALLLLQEEVLAISGNSIEHFGITPPRNVNIAQNLNREHLQEISYDGTTLQRIIQNSEPKLNNEQRQAYDRILNSVNSGDGGVFFLDAPGGTGKTFLTNLLLAKIRSSQSIAIAVASSGIAATLLSGGKTSHSMFKIPIKAEHMENPVCGISKNSDKAKVLQDCVFVVWDECTMANKVSIEAVNRTMQDIRSNDSLFGGVTFLFSGDFRQILPVIVRGTRADEINACIKKSHIWCSVQLLHLTENMRARNGNAEFSHILLQIGEGKTPENEQNEIVLQRGLCKEVESCEALILQIYPDIENIATKENNYFCERSILTPKNDRANQINIQIQQKVGGESVTYTSINTVCDENEVVHYPVEFLNDLNAPGLPAHILNLKVGVPIILMRNLFPPKLCNGTRLRIVDLRANVIAATILTGCGTGEMVLIPRIPMIPSNYPFQFKRLQFPVNLCFAMTINKSQGQTFGKVGVDLTDSCFTHGQLYVACSRVSNSSNLFIHAPGSRTKNIVYKEVLQ